MGKKRENSKNYSQMVAVITALISLTFSVGTAQAVSVLNSCTTYCHGIPPLDGTRKANLHFGSRSSALSGNHRNHLPAAPATASCGICHTPVAATEFGHQNNIIKMANSLKGYSSATLRAKYDKGIFFNQTSIPNLTNARCSNVNCHFEKQTPVWGTSSAGTTCETCHGALISPLTPAHPKHVVALGNTITACNSCHNSHSGTAAYTHATSAGRAITVTVGAYTGSNNRYLPSQTGRVTGTCSLVVCHGSGTLLPWSGALWSTTDQCGKCHSSNAAGAITQAVPFYSTAYPVKVTANTNAKVPGLHRLSRNGHADFSYPYERRDQLHLEHPGNQERRSGTGLYGCHRYLRQRLLPRRLHAGRRHHRNQPGADLDQPELPPRYHQRGGLRNLPRFSSLNDIRASSRYHPGRLPGNRDHRHHLQLSCKHQHGR